MIKEMTPGLIWMGLKENMRLDFMELVEILREIQEIKKEYS